MRGCGALPHVDFRISTSSLPLRFRGARAGFPAHRGYLIADAAGASCGARLEAGGARRCTSPAWRGGHYVSSRDR
jgi:hypothetical protein